ncbi:MAG: 50S ribosomal protein L17 [Candidatus Peribacteraceae bacterium]|jgi:large subunit ribosomal protein L17
MRHRLSRLRLRYKPHHSRALQRNLITSLFLYEAVRTTKKRAEVVQPQVEHLLTVAKTKEPHIAIRAINAVVTHKNASRKIMEVLRLRFEDRTSGFTRIVPLGSRAGDGAKVVSLQLVEGKEVKVAEKKKAVQRTKKTPKKVPSKKS